MSTTPHGNIAAGTVVVDRYRLDSQAGTDLADAAVWQATDTILDRAVRVTLLSGPQAAGALDAARRAALISDQRLARVLDVGTTHVPTPSGDAAQVSYVITEPYAGSSLTEIVSSGLVDAQQARAVVGEAAAALDVAAQRGVHHLALRPEAVRVDGHRVVVTGLGLDAGLAGVEGPGVDGAASDARELAALAYYALTARWAGDSLDEPWISGDTVRPLPAQLDGSGRPVPLSTLVPHVDPVLDDVVQRTLAGGPDAPASPGELAEALRPWGEVSVVAALPAFVQPASGAAAVGAAGAAAAAPLRQSVRPQGTVPGAVGGVERRPTGRIARAASIQGAGAAGLAAGAGVVGAGAAAGAAGMPPVPPPPGSAVPGAFPPPAIPPGGGAARPPVPGASGPAQQWAQAPQGYGQQGYAPQGYAAQQGHPQGYVQQPGAQGGYPASVPVPAQAATGPGGFAVEQAPRRRGVNPTPIVLGLVLVGVILGAGWAVRNALAPVDASVADPSPSVTAPAVDGSPAPEGSPEASPTPEAPALPVIAGAAQAHEAAACSGEQPEQAPLAVDGDPSTFWFTCTYGTPQFGGLREGLGFAVTLREPAPVSSITLLTHSTGGHVQVRKTTVDKPTEGAVLAEGPISPTTELKFAQPEVGESFVLWFTELPQTDGDNRLELVEITVQ